MVGKNYGFMVNSSKFGNALLFCPEYKSHERWASCTNLAYLDLFCYIPYRQPFLRVEDMDLLFLVGQLAFP